MVPAIQPASPASCDKAAALLRGGGVVAFPTETVYGLGADATNGHAVARIYHAKGRPSFNPLICHVADVEALFPLVEVSKAAQVIIEAFWPGSLTLVLPQIRTCPVSSLACAGLTSLAVRMPSHPFALDLLREVGRPVVAPSANMSGSISPTCAQHVLDSLGDRVDLILDGGPCAIGLESTVLDLSGPRPVLLRPGCILQEDIENVLQSLIALPEVGETLKSPGQLASHYAPSCPMRLNALSARPGEVLLGFGPEAEACGATLNLSLQADVKEAAVNLFAMLHRLDQPGTLGIAVMPIPMCGLGVAINDRLSRAAAPRLCDENGSDTSV